MQLLASIINKRGSGSGMNDSIFEMDGVPLCPGHNEPYPTLTSNVFANQRFARRQVEQCDGNDDSKSAGYGNGNGNGGYGDGEGLFGDSGGGECMEMEWHLSARDVKDGRRQDFVSLLYDKMKV